MEIIRWPDEDGILPGVLRINNMERSEFNKMFLKAVMKIRRPFVSLNYYYKKDINNEILRKLQFNENLKDELRNWVSSIEKKLFADDAIFIDYDSLESFLFDVNFYRFSASNNIISCFFIDGAKCEICRRCSKFGKYNKHTEKFVCSTCIQQYNFNIEYDSSVADFEKKLESPTVVDQLLESYGGDY